MFTTVPSRKLLCSLLQLRYQRWGEGTGESCLNPTAVQMLVLSPVVSAPESHLGSVGLHAPPGRMQCSRARVFLSEDSMSESRA